MKEKRKSNIELLRIIAIILIIMHHYAVHGVRDIVLMPLSFEKLWLQFLYNGGKVGVAIFILITGYFETVSSFV